MARPLRIEFRGAVYHVTSRGDRREPIFVDDTDRMALLDVVAQATERFDAEVLAYCLMGNHYHFARNKGTGTGQARIISNELPCCPATRTNRVNWGRTTVVSAEAIGDRPRFNLHG